MTSESLENLIKNDADNLSKWYVKNKRELPWRKDNNPYRIWISEVMLQQTTVQAVIPYFEKFIKKFPDVHTLAQALETEVIKMWAGLGYYSRARNIHKSAKLLSEDILRGKKFPQKFSELISLPGFGPYTSRAVSSLAFEESVGVLDGNVIRVLSRRWALKYPWWQTQYRNELQNLADKLVQHGKPSELNQGLMELGAIICSPEKPMCFLCPWFENCLARSKNEVLEYPLRKPKKANNLWVYQPEINQYNEKILFVKDHQLPFLKNIWVLPGKLKKIKASPQKYLFKHSITNNLIYVDKIINEKLKTKEEASKYLIQYRKLNEEYKTLDWTSMHKISEVSPSSLTTKILKTYSSQT